MNLVDDWKQNWAAKQIEDSDHPLEFWLKVATMLIDGRRYLKADQFSPIGRRWNEKSWQDYLALVLERGETLEQQCGMEAAFVMYEICVAEYYRVDEPYERLRNWYTRRRWYKDAMRIANANLHASWPEGIERPKINVSFKITKRK